MPKEERKWRDRGGRERERRGERQKERMKRCGSGDLETFMLHFTALNYHKSRVKAGMENSAGQSWGQHSPQYYISNSLHILTNQLHLTRHITIDYFGAG